MNVDRVVAAVLARAQQQSTIKAVALVGSHASGTARPESDVDIVILTHDPESFRVNTAWLAAIAGHLLTELPDDWQDEDYGGAGRAAHGWATVVPRSKSALACPAGPT